MDFSSYLSDLRNYDDDLNILLQRFQKKIRCFSILRCNLTNKPIITDFMKKLLVALFLVLVVVGCQKDESQVPANLEVEDFVWKAMNAFYFWQADIPDLQDTRFSSQGQLNDFLNTYNGDPNALFDDLLFQPEVVDRFSVIVDDYIALENSLQGTNESTGMEFGLVRFDNDPNNLFGYVRYVVAGSDAATKGVTRGMLFTHVDGNQLTDANFIGLLFSSVSSFTIELADYNGGNPTRNGTTIQLNKTQVTDNPVLIRKTFDEGPNQIGYLMYNQFASAFDGQLNAAFAQFQAENITDLIIDLRYNGGGSVQTTTYLASMVTGQFNNQLFSQQFWNAKVRAAVDPSIFLNNFRNEIRNTDINGNVILQEAINSLNLNRVFIITKGSTASASELLITGLEGYIDVKTVGTTTLGKHVGSVTLYDSDNLTRTGANLNPNHTYALQPITFEIQNRVGNNYPSGRIPDVQFPEDYNNMGVLGERSDPMLDRTIDYIITGIRARPGDVKNLHRHPEMSDSKKTTPASNNMYFELR